MTDRYDVNAWIETYKETFASFTKAQQDGFKALERLSEKLRALASQESVSNFASDEANRATGARKAA